MPGSRALNRVVHAKAHVSVLMVVVLWAGSFSVIKKLLDDGVAAGDIAILRYAIAAPGFAYILWRARGLRGLTRADGARVAAAGLLVVVGYHMFLNVGTRYTTSGVAALVVALAPGLTMLLAFALGLDRISVRRVVGLAVAFIGVAIVVAFGAGNDLSFESAKGPLIVLGAPLAFALYNVILKPLLGRHDLRTLTQRELNRALLARQLLLERVRLPIPRALERLGGIQDQYAPNAYIRLWSCLEGFERDDLTRALERRSAIQATLMRETIHVVSRRDYWLFAVAIRQAQREWFRRIRKPSPKVRDLERKARELRALLADGPRRHDELVEIVGRGWGMVGPWLDLVRVPPSGTWERRRAHLFQA